MLPNLFKLANTSHFPKQSLLHGVLADSISAGEGLTKFETLHLADAQILILAKVLETSTKHMWLWP